MNAKKRVISSIALHMQPRRPAPTTATTGDGTTDTRGKDTATIGTTAPTTGTAADADSLPEGAKTWIYWAVGVAILLLAGGGAVWLIIKKKA